MARQTPRRPQHIMHIQRCLLVSFLICGSVAAAPSWQQCQTISNDQQRLQCFDQWAATQGSRQAPVSIAPPKPQPQSSNETFNTQSATPLSPLRVQESNHSSESVASAHSIDIERSSNDNIDIKPVASGRETPVTSSFATFGKVDPDAKQQELDTIQLTVAEVTENKHQLLTIRFKEGQTWRQISAERFFVKPNDRCTIKHGLFGSYILKVDGSNRSTKVKRVD